MRLSRADLKQRINGQLSLRYEASGLTSFAGLELIGRFLRSLDFKGRLRRVQGALPASGFGSVPMVLLVLVMLITGARRVRHVGYVQGDPLVERVCGLGRVPTQHTLGRWLRAFDPTLTVHRQKVVFSRGGTAPCEDVARGACI